MELKKSDARILLLYCNNHQARKIFTMANKLRLTTDNYLWIGTQSVKATWKKEVCAKSFLFLLKIMRKSISGMGGLLGARWSDIYNTKFRNHIWYGSFIIDVSTSAVKYLQQKYTVLQKIALRNTKNCKKCCNFFEHKKKLAHWRFFYRKGTRKKCSPGCSRSISIRSRMPCFRRMTMS